MARIRTIKPEFWVDEKIVELSFPARLLFIGMWNFADDFGRMVYSPKKIKMQVFPSDELNISELFGEIRGKKLVDVYTESRRIPPNPAECEEIVYLQIVNFDKHQKVDKRSASKLPAPPNPAEDSREIPLEGKGREGIKEKEKEKEISDLWSLGVSLGVNRAVIGRQIKLVGEEKVGEAISFLAIKKPADPTQYFIASTTPKKRKVVV